MRLSTFHQEIFFTWIKLRSTNEGKSRSHLFVRFIPFLLFFILFRFSFPFTQHQRHKRRIYTDWLDGYYLDLLLYFGFDSCCNPFSFYFFLPFSFYLCEMRARTFSKRKTRKNKAQKRIRVYGTNNWEKSRPKTNKTSSKSSTIHLSIRWLFFLLSFLLESLESHKAHILQSKWIME